MNNSPTQLSDVLEQEHGLSESACAEGLTGNDFGQAREDASSCSSLPKYTSKELGMKGEQAAVRFLKSKGFDILETNWTCFAGEADIIAREDRRDGRDPSGFIDDIAVERELFLDRSGRAVRHGVAVIL